MKKIPWNKGLTKEVDSRVKRYSEKLSHSRRGMKLSKTHKEKIRQSLIGRVPWNKGKRTPEQVKKKLSKAISGKNNHFYGKKHSSESKAKISKSRRNKLVGMENPNSLSFDINLLKQEIIKKYQQGHSLYFLAKEYRVSSTTILNYLKKWSVKRRKSAYGHTKCIVCKDGHKVRSSYEAQIDNFLSSNGIAHKTNERIRKNQKYLYDFYIPEVDLYIEYWGLIRYKKYAQKEKKKKSLYRKHNLQLISIYPGNNILSNLSFLIPLCSKKQKILEL